MNQQSALIVFFAVFALIICGVFIVPWGRRTQVNKAGSEENTNSQAHVDHQQGTVFAQAWRVSDSNPPVSAEVEVAVASATSAPSAVTANNSHTIQSAQRAVVAYDSMPLGQQTGVGMQYPSAPPMASAPNQPVPSANVINSVRDSADLVIQPGIVALGPVVGPPTSVIVEVAQGTSVQPRVAAKSGFQPSAPSSPSKQDVAGSQHVTNPGLTVAVPAQPGSPPTESGAQTVVSVPLNVMPVNSALRVAVPVQPVTNQGVTAQTIQPVVVDINPQGSVSHQMGSPLATFGQPIVGVDPVWPTSSVNPDVTPTDTLANDIQQKSHRQNILWRNTFFSAKKSVPKHTPTAHTVVPLNSVVQGPAVTIEASTPANGANNRFGQIVNSVMKQTLKKILQG